MLAPPVSTASISACVHGVLPNLFGSSLLSKYVPFGGFTLPKELPECPPIAPYAGDEGELGVRLICDDDDDDDDRLCVEDDLDANGPCCCAFDRYSLNEAGRVWFGEAGWGAGL